MTTSTDDISPNSDYPVKYPFINLSLLLATVFADGNPPNDHLGDWFDMNDRLWLIYQCAWLSIWDYIGS
jgi:hypothetical protein